MAKAAEEEAGVGAGASNGELEKRRGTHTEGKGLNFALRKGK